MEFLKRFVNAQRDQETNVSEDESDLLHGRIQELDNLEAVESAESSGEVTTKAGSAAAAAGSTDTAASPASTASTGDTENVKSRPSNQRPVHEGSGSTWKKPKTSMTPTAAVFQEYVNFKKQQILGNVTADHLTKYFQRVEETVRTLPKEIQIKVKSKISQIVHDAELEAMYSTAAPSDL